MRTWARATCEVRCGRCGERIGVGAPMLVFTLHQLAKAKVRCRALTCAGEAVPADLPPLVERVPVPVTPMVHVRSGVGALPLDFKARSAGEREIGEEG